MGKAENAETVSTPSSRRARFLWTNLRALGALRVWIVSALSSISASTAPSAAEAIETGPTTCGN